MKVLIVEDEEKLAQALKSGLKYEGYTVDVASHGSVLWRRKATDGISVGPFANVMDDSSPLRRFTSTWRREEPSVDSLLQTTRMASDRRRAAPEKSSIRYTMIF